MMLMFVVAFLRYSILQMATSEPTIEYLDDDMEEELVSQGEALIAAILERAPFESVKAMVSAGAPIWYQDGEGTSPLHAAAYVENVELIKYLITEGAVWNAGKWCLQPLCMKSI